MNPPRRPRLRRPRRRFGALAVRRPRLAFGGRVLGLVAERLDESLPVFEHCRRVAVDLEPRQRILERAAVHQRALGSRRHFEIGDAGLQRQQLSQPLGIAARNRQHADLDDRLLGWPSELWLQSRRDQVAGVVFLLLFRLDRLERTTFAARHQAERNDQRAEQDRDCATSPARTRTCAGRRRARRAHPTAPGFSRRAGSPA